MNIELMNSVNSVLKQSISGLTSNIYFDHLPDAKLLDTLCVTYSVSNISNEQTFDVKEANKRYSVDIKFNHPVLTNLTHPSIYTVKERLYKNLQCSYIKLIDEDLFFDPELKVWTNFYRYEVQSN